jgi:prefoldin subunit 5
LNNMAKRSTIGENPLDAVSQDHPLNSVVPDLSAVTRGGRGQSAPEVPPEVQERLQGLEAGLQALRTEAAGLKIVAGEAATLKGAFTQVQGDLAGLRREVEALKAEAAAVKALQAELAQFKAEIAQLRASAGPGDLPFWMRGRKK